MLHELNFHASVSNIDLVALLLNLPLLYFGGFVAPVVSTLCDFIVVLLESDNICKFDPEPALKLWKAGTRDIKKGK